MNKNLKAKRDELADAYSTSLKPYLDIHLPTIDFKKGFEEGAAEVMKQASKLVEALELYGNAKHWSEHRDLKFTMIKKDYERHEIFVDGHDCSEYYGGNRARKALAEWKEVCGED